MWVPLRRSQLSEKVPFDIMAIIMDCFLVSLRVVGIAAGLVLLRGLAWLVNLLLLAPRRDPLQHISGPGGSFFQSHLAQASEYAQPPTTTT